MIDLQSGWLSAGTTTGTTVPQEVSITNDEAKRFALKAFDNHINAMPGNEGHPVSFSEGPQWWETDYDSDPTGNTYVARTIIWATNDDGCFVTLIAKLDNWTGDGYRFHGLTYTTSEDDNFTVIERDHWPNEEHHDRQ